MSFFGFNTSSHNQSAPGFSQSHDPFSFGRDDAGEELEFEETYDGLGDQLDETDDAFNDETFGGGGGAPSSGAVGKDFDFFGQTAQVTNAIDEEHVRFNRQQPASKVAQAAPAPAVQYNYDYQQYSQPARTGYEKYKETPIDDLQVDASLWGVPPKKHQSTASTATAAASALPASAPIQAAAPARKILSLEEVEAQMRAQAKKTPQPSTQAQAPAPAPAPAPQIQQRHYQHQQQASFDNTYQYPQQLQQAQQQYMPMPVDNTRPTEPPQGHVQRHSHGHPMTILQRPQSKHAHAPSPGAPSPLHRQEQHQQPQPSQPVQPAHPVQPVQPTQILQNPNRLSGDGARFNAVSRGGRGIPQGPRGPLPPMVNQTAANFAVKPDSAQIAHLSEEEKAAFLDQEAKRAKRNHKIFLMSRDNGIMTPQDKNFITRIQLQQLVSATGNPNELGTDESLAEDFYYQVHSQIQGGQRQHPSQPLNNFAQTYLFQTGSRQGGMRRGHRGADNHVQRMEQQVQRAVEAAKNKPKNKQLVIEGSLGKISFSNAKTPKPLLNIKRTDSSGDANRPSTGNRTQTSVNGLSHKSALRSIEIVYDTLMKMEDHERYRPPPPANDQDTEATQKVLAWDAEARKLNDQLWKALKVMEPVGVYPVHPFITLLSYSKAMKAIQRIFRNTTQEQRTTILTLVVVSLDTLDVVRGAQVNTNDTQLNSAIREKIDLFSHSVMSTLFNFMNELDLDIVAGILGIVCTRNVDIIAKSKIGASMLTMILSRAEIIKHGGGGNQQTWQIW
jgi:DNA topoisomerase 2-associated protein PAT1